MQMSQRALSPTMKCPRTGVTLTRGVRPFVVAYAGAWVSVDLPGYYPVAGNEGVHVGDDMAIVDLALLNLTDLGPR